MNGIEWSLVIAGAGLGTYALRVAPFLSERLYRVGQNNLRFLTYVSLAIAAGIVARAIAFSGGSVASLSDIGIKIVAVLAALGLHRLTRNLPIALFFGVGLAACCASASPRADSAAIWPCAGASRCRA